MKRDVAAIIVGGVLGGVFAVALFLTSGVHFGAGFWSGLTGFFIGYGVGGFYAGLGIKVAKFLAGVS